MRYKANSLLIKTIKTHCKYDYKILSIVSEKLSPRIPSVSLPKLRVIYINGKWHIHNQLPFQICHEIGHVLNGDTHIGFNDQTEILADKKAINILVPLYAECVKQNEIKTDKFMNDLFIPAYLLDYVKKISKPYFLRPLVKKRAIIQK